jgi:hypothetical protein
MINNEFNIIGIATSEYEKDNWDNYILRVEVEKMGSKEGNVFECEVKIYGNNRMVDTARKIQGEQVAVNGYVDFFTSKKGVSVLRLVAQRVYVLGEQKRKQLAASAPASVSYDAPAPTEVAEAVDSINVDADDTPW